PNVASLNGVSAYLDGTDTQVAGTWTQLINGRLTVTGGAYTLPGLTDVENSDLVAQGGNLALPQLTHFTANNTLFQADGGVLDVSALSSVTMQGSWQLYAVHGG